MILSKKQVHLKVSNITKEQINQLKPRLTAALNNIDGFSFMTDYTDNDKVNELAEDLETHYKTLVKAMGLEHLISL